MACGDSAIGGRVFFGDYFNGGELWREPGAFDFAGLLGGFVSEYATSGLSFQLYFARSFAAFEWSNFYPPTLKTAVFGFIIGTVSSYSGYTTNEGSEGVGRAATRSVVASSLAIILADVLLIKTIFFMFPEGAL